MFLFARRVVSLSSSRVWKTRFSSQVCSKRLVWPPFWPTAQVPTLCWECTHWSGPGGSSQCPFLSSFSFMMKPENSSSAEILAAGLKTRLIIKFSKILWYRQFRNSVDSIPIFEWNNDGIMNFEFFSCHTYYSMLIDVLCCKLVFSPIFTRVDAKFSIIIY